MKNILKLWSVVLLGSVSAQSWGVLISDPDAGIYNGWDVGSVDTYLVEGDKQGNPASEEAWVQANGYPDLMFSGVKDDPVTYFDTDTANVIAFMLSTPSDYFLIKNAQKIALFDNSSNKKWGVINIDDLQGKFNIAVGKDTISHATFFKGGSTEVSQPGTLALLSIGLVALLRGRSIRHKFS